MGFFAPIERQVDKVLNWFYAHVLRNPSGQDQIKDHFYPNGFQCFVLLCLPYGVYLGLFPVIRSIWEEFIDDGHRKDFFSKTDSGADGRVDLFFKLLGCGIAYLVYLTNK